MEVIGTIIVLDDTKQITDSFRKRDFVVETDEQYKQTIPIQFVQDKCDILNGYAIGQNVKVSTNLQGKKWTNQQGEDKYFLSLNAWRIENMTQSQGQDMPPVDQYQPNITDGQECEPDDLPF